MSFGDNVKFLDVTLDRKLKFKEHINNVCIKLSKVVGILYRVWEYLPEKSLINLYYIYSFFYPYLLYVIVLWDGTYSTHMHTVEMLQKSV